MLVGVCSDVHGRTDRLQAFIDAARQDGAQELWCLGDVVDALTGADPEQLAQTVELVLAECDLVLGGNHELWSLQNGSLAPRTAQEISGWTPRDERHGVAVTHASMRDPFMEFITTPVQAGLALDETPGWLALHGHTHQRRLWASIPEAPYAEKRPTRGRLEAAAGEKLLACPGALTGARPCWLLVDLHERALTWRRLPV